MNNRFIKIIWYKYVGMYLFEVLSLWNNVFFLLLSDYQIKNNFENTCYFMILTKMARGLSSIFVSP